MATNINDVPLFFSGVSLANFQPASYTAAQAVSFAGWSTSSVNALRSLNAGETSAAVIARAVVTLINDLMNPNRPTT
jgi:hypothetical protein